MQAYEPDDPVPPGYRHVYVEPHLDDVALSCGGLVAGQRSRGEPVLVVTLFAGRPPADAAVGAFAAWQHARWGQPDDPVAARWAEQRAALARLGADWLRLDFLDAIYRGDRYRSDDELFGPVRDDEWPLAERIGQRLAALAAGQPGATWYVPLAVGTHVDHQIALAAARRLADPLGYEDFPYAGQPGRVDERTARLGLGVGDARLEPIGDWIEPKIAAVACYASQLPVLFGRAAAMPAAVRAYADAVGQGTPAERYWRLGRASPTGPPT